VTSHVFRICFVCSGNICRSPTAEVVLIQQLRLAGLAAGVQVGSAGTGGWHAGEDMDERSRATLDAAGYLPPTHVAKQFTAADFAERDLVIALDRGHQRLLEELAGETEDPAANRAKVVLLRYYDPHSRGHGDDWDVADPYYGGDDGFTDVLAQIERSCAALVEELRAPRSARQP
jgi:protein-tyrosine phosphatase